MAGGISFIITLLIIMTCIKTDKKKQILRSATKLILAEGNFFPSSQELACGAGISRTALHYYYNTKDEITVNVSKYALSLLRDRNAILVDEDATFEQSVASYASYSLQLYLRFPFLDSYLSIKQKMIHGLEGETVMNTAWYHKVNQLFLISVAAGKLRAMRFEQFFLALLTISSIPWEVHNNGIVSRKLIATARKELVLTMILSGAVK